MDPYASSSSLLSPPASASPTPSPPSPKRRRTQAGNQQAIPDSDEDDRVAGFRCSAGFVSVKGRPLDGRGECRQHDSGYGEELAERAPGKESWKVRWSDLSWTHLEMCSVTMNTHCISVPIVVVASHPLRQFSVLHPRFLVRRVFEEPPRVLFRAQDQRSGRRCHGSRSQVIIQTFGDI